jgi:hypothetical protein
MMAIRFRTPLVLALLAAACGTTPASYGARTEAVDAHVANEWRMAETADAAHEHAIAVGHAAHAMPSALATDIVHPMLPVERLVDAHIDFLASDDMGGRETGTVHSQLTGQYVASVFRAAGLTPGAEDGSYLQSYPMSAQRTLLDATRMDVTSADGAVTSPLELFDDYRSSRATASSAKPTAWTSTPASTWRASGRWSSTAARPSDRTCAATATGAASARPRRRPERWACCWWRTRAPTAARATWTASRTPCATRA